MFKIILAVIGVVLAILGLVIKTPTHSYAISIIGVCLVILVAVVDAASNRSRNKKPKRQLSALREYNFPATVRGVFCRENPRLTESQTDLAFDGLKQYFALILLERHAGRTGSLGMPSVLVDEAWHAFVLCTADYEEFCKKIFGRMVHHYPDAGVRPGRLTGDTLFKDDVLNTWSAYGRGSARYPHHFATIDNVPLLFALDSYASHPSGWLWTPPAISALAEQAERHQDACRRSESSSGASSTGSSCGGACFGSAGPFGQSYSSSTPSSSKSSSSKHSSGDVGSSCSSRPGSSCGSSCKSSSSSSGSSCGSGSSCSSGSSCGGGD